MFTDYQLRSLSEDLEAFKGIALLLCEEDPVAKAEAQVVFRDLEDLISGHGDAAEEIETLKETIAEHKELTEEAVEEAVEEATAKAEKEKEKLKEDLWYATRSIDSLKALCTEHDIPFAKVTAATKR